MILHEEESEDLEYLFQKAIEVIRYAKAKTVKVKIWPENGYKLLIENYKTEFKVKLRNGFSRLEVEGDREAVLRILANYESLWLWKCHTSSDKTMNRLCDEVFMAEQVLGW